MRAVILNLADFANLSLLPAGSALQDKLARAVLVVSAEVPADVVTMQSRVILGNEATGERRLVSVVYPSEAEESGGRVSVLDSLCTWLLGARVGDAIDLELADSAGRLHVEDIVYQPEHSMRTNLVLRDYPEGIG